MRAVRSVLWLFAKVVVVVVLAVLVAIVVLRVTNPRPGQRVGWREKAPIPTARGETASAQIGKRLIVAGGMSGAGTASRDVDVYDARFDAWLRGVSLPQARHHAAAAAAGEHVYVAGGARTATDWTPMREVWRAEPGERWRAVAEMPEGRQGHAMVELEGKLYVVGGAGPTDDTLIYDVRDNEWSTGAHLPAGRDHLRAVAWDGKVWAIGGRSGAVTRRVDVYDPKADAWESGPDLPTPMSAMAVGVVTDDLHVIGGEDPRFFGGGTMNEHYQLSLNDEVWGVRPSPRLAVHGAAYGVFERSLIVAGGASRHGALSIISWTDETQTYTVRSIKELSQD